MNPLKECALSLIYPSALPILPGQNLSLLLNTLYPMSIHWGSFLTFCRILFYALPSNFIDPPNFSDATRKVVSFDVHWAVIPTRIKFASYIDKPTFIFQTHFQWKCSSLTVIYILPLLIYLLFGLCLKFNWFFFSLPVSHILFECGNAGHWLHRFKLILRFEQWGNDIFYIEV